MELDKINFEIEKLLELAFRKGYSHGFQHSKSFPEHENFEKMMQEILEWRTDLTNMKASPGGNMREIDLPWCDMHSLQYKEMIIRKEHWENIEKKMMLESQERKKLANK